MTRKTQKQWIHDEMYDTHYHRESWLIDKRYHRLMFVFILVTSPVSVITSFCLLQGHVLIKLLNSVVMTASVSFWFFPVYGWRRNCDVVAVVCDMCVHYSLCLRHIPHLLPLYVGSHWMFYRLSWRAFHHGNSLWAVVYWMVLHVSVHLFNILFYINIAYP